jgi:WD repeat-containing protein 23
VSPKGDGHHLISNCKDQTVKLWDTRRAVTPAQAAAAARNAPRIPRWDYRWEDYPGEILTRHLQDSERYQRVTTNHFITITI